MAGPVPEPYGRSLALEDGDLVLEPTAAGERGARVVSGEQNLLQALELRVGTPLGTDRFNVTYGLDTRQIFTTGGGVRTTKDLIRLNLVRTLGGDRRIRDVRDIVFMDDPAFMADHGIGAEEARLARRSRLWSVQVELELVPAGDLTLRLEVGPA
jgi:hypothetical protein